VDKLNLIRKINKLHPSRGVHKGWSVYVGGMKDSGHWYLEHLADASLEELEEFYEENTRIPDPIHTCAAPNGMEERYQMEQFYKEMDREMIFGIVRGPRDTPKKPKRKKR